MRDPSDTMSIATATKGGGDHRGRSVSFAPSKPKADEGDTRVLTTWPEMIRAWPKTTVAIVSNEFCERFSYYGMRTVLTFYLLNVLKFSDNQSTIFFNGFTVLCYLTPMLGSIIADGYIGKFWTIFSVSILYACGQVILAIASTKKFDWGGHPVMDLVGLIVIGFGTGGIKPCVSSFGGDQFDQKQTRMLSLFFSMFYFSINAGSMISTFISPIFRSQPCMGQDSCYPLAFGVPAILMVTATGVFMAGSFWYKKPPPTMNVFGEVYRVMRTAIGNKISLSVKRDHWLEHYLDTHFCEHDTRCRTLQEERGNKTLCQKKKFVEDIKSLLRVLVMFLPVPMFWALYDQQGSIWLIQGIQMDCRLWGNTLLLPDQMQTLNAVLILCFIPLFQVIVYPLASKLVTLTPLRKMVVGGLLASLSFFVTGFVQLRVNQTLPSLPSGGQTYVSFMNMVGPGCSIVVTPDGMNYSRTLAYNETQMDKHNKPDLFRIKSGPHGFTIQYNNCGNTSNLPTSVNYDFPDKKIAYVAVTSMGTFNGTVKSDKPTEGTGEFGLALAIATTNQSYTGNMCVCRVKGTDFGSNPHPCNARNPSDFYFWEQDYDDHTTDFDGDVVGYITGNGPTNSSVVQRYKKKSVRPGKWRLYYLDGTPKDVDHKTPARENVTVYWTGHEFEIRKQGGVYLFAGYGLNPHTPDLKVTVFQVVQDNSVNIVWQIPQIVILTAAEILFSITGYEFAYSQSAPSMKALLQALWLFTTAVGDSIIVLITALDLFENMATEFFAYAGAMTVVIIIFALMSAFYYEYKYYTVEDEYAQYENEASAPQNGSISKHAEEDRLSDYLPADQRL